MSPIPPPTGFDGKISFPNMIGAKRRRMRSGGNVSTGMNNLPAGGSKSPNLNEEKVAETSRCKGATTIPIFLKSRLLMSKIK